MRALATLAAGLCLGACVSISPPIPLDGVPAAFRMTGRLAVTHPGGGEILRLAWDRSATADVWTLLSPVGAEVARIERDGEGVTVYRPGMAPISAPGLAQVTSALLGAELDERLLVAWLHGRAHSGPAGWRVDIEHEAGAGSRARRVTAASGEATVRLVVDRYEAVAP